jgi:hypothetical protein
VTARATALISPDGGAVTGEAEPNCATPLHNSGKPPAAGRPYPGEREHRELLATLPPAPSRSERRRNVAKARVFIAELDRRIREHRRLERAVSEAYTDELFRGAA